MFSLKGDVFMTSNKETYVSKCYLKFSMENSAPSSTDKCSESKTKSDSDTSSSLCSSRNGIGMIENSETAGDDDLSNSVQTTTQAQYEPIRVLGRGAFGEAVLYRRVEVIAQFLQHNCQLYEMNKKEN